MSPPCRRFPAGGLCGGLCRDRTRSTLLDTVSDIGRRELPGENGSVRSDRGVVARPCDTEAKLANRRRKTVRPAFRYTFSNLTPSAAKRFVTARQTTRHVLLSHLTDAPDSDNAVSDDGADNRSRRKRVGAVRNGFFLSFQYSMTRTYSSFLY